MFESFFRFHDLLLNSLYVLIFLLTTSSLAFAWWYGRRKRGNDSEFVEKYFSRYFPRAFYGLIVMLVAALAVGYLTSSLRHERTISEIEALTGGEILHLDGGEKYLVDFEQVSSNKVNSLLLYHGKRVWVMESNQGCSTITPIKHDPRPKITMENYRSLTEKGFSHADIEISFRTPFDTASRNGEIHAPWYLRLLGVETSTGAPSICGERLSKEELRR